MTTGHKIASSCFVGLMILGLNTSVLSQNRGEIFDITPTILQMNQAKTRLERYQTITDSLAKYPEENVTYVFNGKPSDTISGARRSLFINLDYIETISTSEHDQGGKRLIAVKFRLH